MQIDVTAYFGTSLLDRHKLGRLQDICRTLAPSWSEGLRICDPYKGTAPIRVMNADSLYESVSQDVTSSSPLLEKLAREHGPLMDGGLCRVIELGGNDRSMTIVMSLDHRSFRKNGSIMIWGNHISFQLRRNAKDDAVTDHLARCLLEEICMHMDPWYAHAKDIGEFRAKNILKNNNGTRAIGVDVSRSLPGLYWLNYFGPLCVDEIGRSRFADCPAFEKRNMGDGVWLALGLKSGDWPTEDYMLRERAVIASLGQEFFFLRTDQERDTRSPFRGYMSDAGVQRRISSQ
jgi:hypothetical protein